MKKYDVGFIGYGNMAQAIVAGLVSMDGKYILKHSAGCKLRIAVSDLDEEKLMIAPKNVAATKDTAGMVDACDVIILAIKPQQAKEALAGLDFTGKIVVSIMASVTIDAIKSITGNATNKIVRVMPNLNARIGCAFSTFTSSGLSADEKRLVSGILLTIGDFREINEDQMNSATGLCGSGPAFVFKFINALIEDAVKNGIEKEIAVPMALGTVVGSANLVDATFAEKGLDYSIDELVKSVCSKGGTTIQGVNFLNENNFDAIISGAVDKAVARAEEMSKDNEKC